MPRREVRPHPLVQYDRPDSHALSVGRPLRCGQRPRGHDSPGDGSRRLEERADQRDRARARDASHHGPDVQSVLPKLNIHTVAVKVPTTIMHLHTVTVDLKKAASAEAVLDVWKRF